VVISDIRDLGTVLSIWAHPDDEAYLCGGIMAIATAAGSRVVCLTVIPGELGVTDPMRWPPEQLPAIREAELAACLEILGIKEHRWLGYPDGRCADADGHAAAEQIAEIILQIAPDTILTFPADGQTGHPDHIAVHRWTVEAVRCARIGTLHVVANTRDRLDDQLPQWIELGRDRRRAADGVGRASQHRRRVDRRAVGPHVRGPWPRRPARPRRCAR
jgi:LmbE family N-acetylglucosaminyl deacetylase